MSPESEPYDIAIIGGGPAGYVGGIKARQMGARAVVIERGSWGGTCLNIGCIPTRTMVSTAEVLRSARMGREMGLSGNIEVDYDALIQHRERVVGSLVNGVRGLLKSNGVASMGGAAQLVSHNEIKVRSADGEQTVRARNILIATGSVPARPPVSGLDLPGVVDSTGILALTEQPKELVIIGGGHIGLEFASIFANIGTKVEIIEILPRILTGFEEELARRLQRMLERDGVRFHVQSEVHALEQLPSGRLQVRYLENGAERAVTCDKVLYATGRCPYTDNLGVEAAGIETAGGTIKVNDRLQTNIPGVYAAGDVVFRYRVGLAHVAWTEAQVAIRNMLGRLTRMEYSVIPAVVHSIPELAGVGLTEAAAQERGYEISVLRAPFSPNGRALGMGHPHGLVKIVAEAGTGDLLGAHVLGPHASALIAELALAIEMGATAADVGRTIHAHPTLSEVVQEAALSVARGVSRHRDA